MKELKSHFVFNKSERNGIFLLVLIIVVLQGIYFFYDSGSDEAVPSERMEEIARFQQQLDSMKALALLKDTLSIYPFNPNFITDYKGYTLGMSLEEIDRLHAYRAADRWVNSAKEFQEVTKVSDSLLQEISPYFKFPEWVTNSVPRKVSAAPSFPVQDLNKATAEELRRVNGVGEVLSARIVKYRESIGGFIDEEQLNDVYGLEPEVVERVRKSFRILEAQRIEKQDLNLISLLALSEIPGLDYELAREVIAYRTQKERIETFEELGNIKGFPEEKIKRIQLYLAINRE